MNQLTAQPDAAASRATRERRTARRSPGFESLAPGFIVLHIGLAFIMAGSSRISTVHAVVTLALGVYFLLRDREPYRLIYLCGYITGVELLWRGTGASVFWEIGKYAVSLFLLLALVKRRGFARVDILPLLYFLFLVPSAVQAVDRRTYPFGLSGLTLLDYPFYFLGLDREAIAYNLAGPFALAVAAMYFSTVKLKRSQVRTLLAVMLAPIVGLLALAVRGTITAPEEELQLIHASSELTAAGIGPNQVSSILGLGALVAFLLVFAVDSRQRFLQIALSVLALVLIVQTMLTFSRGGLWTAVAAAVAALLYLLRDRRVRLTVLAGALVIFLIFNFVLLPFLDDLTGGNLTARFSDPDTTGRDEIVQSELQVFRAHPIFGIGPGQARPIIGDHPHTEYTRALAEHGLLGAASILCLLLIGLKRYQSKLPPVRKAFVAALTVWTLLFMAHSATRLVAPSFTFGLASAIGPWDDDKT